MIKDTKTAKTKEFKRINVVIKAIETRNYCIEKETETVGDAVNEIVSNLGYSGNGKYTLKNGSKELNPKDLMCKVCKEGDILVFVGDKHPRA